MSDSPLDIPSFLLGRAAIGGVQGEATKAGWKDIGPPPHRGPYATTHGLVTLVAVVDASRPGTGIEGHARLPGYLNNIDVGTVLVHRPVLPAIPPLERPWQAGRMHRDGVHWEEQTWPPDDFSAFRDHVGALLNFTVPGDERWSSRNLPVVGVVRERERPLYGLSMVFCGVRTGDCTIHRHLRPPHVWGYGTFTHATRSPPLPDRKHLLPPHPRG